jgi:F0F1-type ATP synthase membrane subunit b/b'
MNVEQLIEEIEVYVDNCKSTGVLGGGSMIKVNREELMAMLEELRDQLPRELGESRQVLATRESILADARAKGERMVQDAAKEAGILIDENEIVNLAKMRAAEIIDDTNAEADQILANARETAKSLQQGALEYTQSMMAGMESLYSTMIEQEKQYFDAVISKLKDDHKQIVENKREIDLQLGYNKTSRRKEDFESREEEEE